MIEHRAAFLADLAHEAGLLALQMRDSLTEVSAKTPLDFCTEADRAVERLIRDRVTERFGDSVLGEEYGGAVSDRVWVVDPIDGTMNYIFGVPRWCVSIAYVEHGVLELGAIHAPALGVLFTARRGCGAFANQQPIRVSHVQHGVAPVVEVGFSERRPIDDYVALVGRLMSAGFEFRRLGSGALAMADVAQGRHDGYLELHINAWDVLAGLLLVQEAGGFTSDFLANDGLTQGNSIIACTPEISARLAPLMPRAHA